MSKSCLHDQIGVCMIMTQTISNFYIQPANARGSMFSTPVERIFCSQGLTTTDLPSLTKQLSCERYLKAIYLY